MADPLPIFPDPYLGEIRLYASRQIPDGWAPCDGRLLKVVENDALFSLIGNTYGGDGQTNFALPDLRGRVPIGVGEKYTLGQSGGEEFVTLSESELPAHTHTVNANIEGGTGTPVNNYWGYSSSNPYAAAPGNVTMNEASLMPFGNGARHENRIPFQAVNYIIALKGRYPG